MKWIFVHIPPEDGDIQVLDTTSEKISRFEKVLRLSVKLSGLMAALNRTNIIPMFFG
jgi:hypothetical protein